MSEPKPPAADLLVDDAIGRSIVTAGSNLVNFVVELEGGIGLHVEAHGGAARAALRLSIEPACALPKVQDAVCTVDWGWIAGSRIRSVTVTGERVQLVLDPAGSLTVSALLWQGSPFLAFQPFRPPQRC